MNEAPCRLRGNDGAQFSIYWPVYPHGSSPDDSAFPTEFVIKADYPPAMVLYPHEVKVGAARAKLFPRHGV